MTTSTRISTVATAPRAVTHPTGPLLDDGDTAFDDFGAGTWADFTAARAIYLRRRAEIARAQKTTRSRR